MQSVLIIVQNNAIEYYVLHVQCFTANQKWLFSTSDSQHTSALNISNNKHTATLVEPTTLWEIAVCEPCKEAITFNIRIVKHQMPSYLLIGFIEQKSNIMRAAKNSWCIDIYKKQLVECNSRRQCSNEPIKEGSLITIEKDCTQCALRFFVNNKELNDRSGQVIGWLKTNLSQKKFEALVGCVWLWNESDYDLTVTIEAEPERMTNNQH